MEGANQQFPHKDAHHWVILSHGVMIPTKVETGHFIGISRYVYFDECLRLPLTKPDFQSVWMLLLVMKGDRAMHFIGLWLLLRCRASDSSIWRFLCQAHQQECGGNRGGWCPCGFQLVILVHFHLLRIENRQDQTETHTDFQGCAANFEASGWCQERFPEKNEGS